MQSQDTAEDRMNTEFTPAGGSHAVKNEEFNNTKTLIFSLPHLLTTIKLRTLTSHQLVSAEMYAVGEKKIARDIWGSMH